MLFCIEICLGFVRPQYSKQHQEQVEIRFWTGMLGDILENSILLGDQVVNYYI
jgi:hypothetical protein